MRLERRAVVLGDAEANRLMDEEEKKEGFVWDDGENRPREDVKIVAVDLQPIAKLEGVVSLVADITDSGTIPRILKALDPEEEGEGRRPVDLVISDGAPDVTGLHDLDIYIQSQLLFSALNLALRVLKPGGKFVAKIFRGKDVDFIYAQMSCFFEKVTCAKPRSSRASSLEAFVVCEGFKIPKGFDVEDMLPLGIGNQVGISEAAHKEQATAKEAFVDGERRTTRDDGVTILELENLSLEDEKRESRWIAPFVACGDLSAWDADATYHLPKNHVSLPPVQPPTNPPYKTALEERKKQGGFYGKTKK